MAPRFITPPDPVDLTDDDSAFAVAPGSVVTPDRDAFEAQILRWRDQPVAFVCEALREQPDPWQCDVMDALLEYDNVALRACHGAGKTKLEGWVVAWFVPTHAMAQAITTAPTFNKQVRDVLWATNIRASWQRLSLHCPAIFDQFTLLTTRLQNKRHSEWFAVGVASNTPINTEGYHAPHLLAVFDEAKGIKRLTWEAIQGMRTTQRAKLLVGSTPGGPTGEFYKVFTEYRQTWKSLFVIHPEALRRTLNRPEAPEHSTSGTYYSDRVRADWVESRRLEWGEDSAVFVARVRGDFPLVEGDTLIPYAWLERARDTEEDDAIDGPVWVSCDVARYGRDRTIVLVGRGGAILHGESISRFPGETTVDIETLGGVGDDPDRPQYRAITATADLCLRLRQRFSADGVIIDDTGLGGGVSDILRKAGEKVVMAIFGSAPTDRARTPEQKKQRERRHRPDSFFADFKMQMAWALRNGFEQGQISLAALPEHIVTPIIAQTSLVKTELNAKGLMRVIDPDELDEEASLGYVDEQEGRRSPDHFHALLLLWWQTGTAGALLPVGHALLSRRQPVLGPSAAQTVGGKYPPVFVGGQARHLGGLYRSRR